MVYQDNSAEAQAGQRGEQAVDQWMRSQGIWRLQVSDLKREARFLGPKGEQQVIALDRLYAGGGISYWCDIKWKSGPVIYQKTQTFRHGIDKRNWEHYLEVQKKTGIPAKLAIVELRRYRGDKVIAPRLLVQDLDVLERLIATTVNPYGKSERIQNGIIEQFQSVNWDRDVAFIDMGEIDIGEGPVPQTQRNLRPWEWPARDGTFRMPKKREDDLFTQEASEDGDAYAAAQGRRTLPSVKITFKGTEEELQNVLSILEAARLPDNS